MSKSRPRNAGHILALSENQQGKDLIIGDIHGNIRTLNDVINGMGEHDRLFIVGDLFDRGRDNIKILRAIRALNRDRGTRGEIYCVRGNHESLCLDTIAALERVGACLDLNVSDQQLKEFRDANDNQELGKLTVAYMRAIESADAGDMYQGHDFDLGTIHAHADKRNGGMWVVSAFLLEIQKGYIVAENDVIVYHPKSQIRRLKKFINELPYIIHVDGQLPFNVVHADMPVSDSKLNRLIRHDSGLRNSEIEHATWERATRRDHPRLNGKKTGRLKDSVVTYVGHSIVSEGNLQDCVRPNTNTINLDVASYYTSIATILNHTDGVCDISCDVAEGDYLHKVVGRINKHLATLPDKEKSRQFKLGKKKKSKLKPKKTSAAENLKPSYNASQK